jgi:3-phosphoshikimate 1-carboxyvinyltransferase
VRAPGSKAYTHRALIGSLLTRGETNIHGALVCDDTCNTLDAVEELGGRVREGRNEITIRGSGALSSPGTPIDCGESGATLRFLAAVSCACSDRIVLMARSGLAERPIKPLLDALEKLGASIQLQQAPDHLRLGLQGPLKGGGTSINGDISSQFITGLLMAAPLARRDVELTIGGRIESRPYVDLTLAILKQHGIKVEEEKGTFYVPAPQTYQPTVHSVPSDFSSTAFLIAAGGTAGDKISLTGFEGSYQLEPDSAILGLLPKMGVKIERTSNELTVSKSQIQAFEFDASNYPDLVPVLEVLAAQAQGQTKITGVKRLRYKESDRLATIPEELTKMGAKIRVGDDLVVIDGVDRLNGGRLSSHRDHRVAMACATAALAATGESVIDDAGVVSKSYPAFFTDMEKLGAHFDVE